MKKIACLALITFLSSFISNGNATGAERGQNIQLKRTGNGSQWLTIDTRLQFGVDRIFEATESILGLGPADEMIQMRESQDRDGTSHHVFRQHHHGLPVEAAEMRIHVKENFVYKMNGVILPGLAVDPEPSLSEGEALEFALDHVAAEMYMWEDADMEQFLKLEQRDESASFFPAGKLLIICKDFQMTADQARLAWKFDVYAETPRQREWIYVDAHDGTLLTRANRLHSDDVFALGTSLYNGVVNFTADSFDEGFRLHQVGRADVLSTYDMQNTTDFSNAVLFDDPDGAFNDAWDQPGVSVHWAAELCYDYYLNNHGRDSFDDAGQPILCYAHYDEDSGNAFWDGARLKFGDGDGVFTTPIVSIDVVGHEFTHGVTEHSAGLIYEREYGALNESFSDIFGAVVEFDTEGEAGDWTLGEDYVIGGAVRSLSNPGGFGLPDTYGGNNWVDPDCDEPAKENDWCGVHINSSVQNYWFFLLSQGGEASNDNGDDFYVEGIGTAAAADIAYRNLTNYLGPTSEYVDAGMGARDAAIDFYGVRSPELNAVANAWHAVGVTDGANVVYDNGDVISTEISHTAGSTLLAGDYTIANGGGAELFAGSQVVLSPPFKAESGSDFRASIFARSAPPAALIGDPQGEPAAATEKNMERQQEIEAERPETLNSLVAIPDKHFLAQNYPNPFNPRTKIRYGLKDKASVSLKIYDMLGRLVKTLQNDTQAAGYYNLEWDGRDDVGQRVASGVYLYRIDIKSSTSGNHTAYRKTLKLMLVR